LLVVFLSSEGVKGYNKAYSIVLMVVAVIQVIRIFTTPVLALTGNSWFISSVNTNALEGHYFEQELKPAATATILIIYLAASAACLAAASVIGYIYAKRLENFTKAIESGEISIEGTLKAMDEEEQAAANAGTNGAEVK
jgi:HAMP domain-containing protein